MSTIREDLLPQPGDVIAEHYQIEKLLGHGGMGAVFAAKHTRTGRAVAIKWMLPQAATSTEALARFISEARATARIEHPNVVHIYDFGEANGSPFLVMERLRGRSLREHLDLVGRLSPTDAIHLLVPAMRGVAEAHREGIIHRDIKPDNIFLCQGKDGSPREAKVVDFGISKLYDGDKMSSLTGTGMMMGTPAYMSPEQLNAPKDADPRFDVYAFGVVLYEALTGHQPYEADGIFQLVAEIMKAEPIPPSRRCPDIPPVLDGVVLRAMHKDAGYRYGSMAEMIAAFDAVRPHLGMGPPPSLFGDASTPYAATVATGPMPGQPTPSTPFPITHMATPAPVPLGYSPGYSPVPPHTPPPMTPPRPMQATAVLTPPSQPGYYSQPGHTHPGYAHPVPIGTPDTPYAAPKKSGLGKILGLGAVALLLGGATAAGAIVYLASQEEEDDRPPEVRTHELSAPPVTDPEPTGPAGTEPPPGTDPTAVNPPVAEAAPRRRDRPGDVQGAEPVVEPAPEPVVEPVVEPAPEPVVEPAPEPEPIVEPEPERPHRPRTEPPRPVVRPMPPGPSPQPIIRPAPPPPRPGQQRGANGALIIE